MNKYTFLQKLKTNKKQINIISFGCCSTDKMLIKCSVQRLQTQTSHDRSDRRTAPQGPIRLKLDCDFPLRMVNGLHLYRVVIPKALHGASHSPTTCCRRPAPQSWPDLLQHLGCCRPSIHINCVICYKKSISARKVSQNWFCVLQHIVCLSVPHLFSSLSSCFCLPSTQSSPQSCTSVSFSSLLFLSLLLDPSRRLHSDRNSLPSAPREGKVLLGLSYQNPASNSILHCGEVLFFREKFLDERESAAPCAKS